MIVDMFFWGYGIKVLIFFNIVEVLLPNKLEHLKLSNKRLKPKQHKL